MKGKFQPSRAFRSFFVFLKKGTTNSQEKELEHLLEDAKELADSSVGFWHAFVASISVILVSEIGDKTFFIAAIMAMRHSRLTIFFGAISALFLMTVLSGKKTEELYFLQN